MMVDVCGDKVTVIQQTSGIQTRTGMQSPSQKGRASEIARVNRPAPLVLCDTFPKCVPETIFSKRACRDGVMGKPKQQDGTNRSWSRPLLSPSALTSVRLIDFLPVPFGYAFSSPLRAGLFYVKKRRIKF